MTNQEWLILANDLLHYNGKVNNTARQVFIRELKRNPNYIDKARALFGDRGSYDASQFELEKFIKDVMRGKTETRFEKDDKGNYTKIIKKV